VMLSWRLLLATGDQSCADVIERTTYNAILPALSLDGTSFFYVNPLQRRTHRAWAEAGTGERAPWYACACCPPNLMRLIASWPQLVATTDDRGVRIHQYASAEIDVSLPAGTVRLSMETDYPWEGRVRTRVLDAPDEPVELSFRIPGWCGSATLRDSAGGVDRRGDDEAIGETRVWQPGDTVELDLEMPIRVTDPDPRIDAIRGCVALERGPLVYAIETADIPAGMELEDVALPAGVVPSAVPRADLAPGLVGLATHAIAGDAPVEVGAIPYFAWANREVAGMRVWIPRADQ
jgi:DUF1680 family protein